MKKLFYLILLLIGTNLLCAQQPRLMLPLGHTSYVNLAKFSPDGKRIVTASSDNNINLWDVYSGALLARLKGYSSIINSVQFSRDSKRIVSAGDSSVKIWDAATGKLIADLNEEKSFVNSAVFSPDGKKIVSSYGDHITRIWNAYTGILLIELKGHSDATNSAEFSLDGKKIVTASDDSTAKVWDAATGLLLVNLKTIRGAVRTAQFSPDGKKVVTVSDDSSARIWDVVSGKILVNLGSHSSYIYSAQFSSDSKKIVTASQDGTAKIWDANNGRMIANLKANKLAANSGPSDVVSARKSVQFAAFSPDGDKIITTAGDNTVAIWNANTGMLIFNLVGHTAAVLYAEFSADGKKVVSASSDKTAKIWEVASGNILADLKGHSNKINAARFNMEANKIVTASWDNAAKIWNVFNGSLLADLKGHRAAITSAEFSPDGNKIVTASLDKTAKIWDAINGKLLKDLNVNSSSLYQAGFSPDGKNVVTVYENVAEVWDVVTGMSIVELIVGADISIAQFSPDGKKILTISSDNFAITWDAVTGKQLMVKEAQNTSFNKGIQTASFSPDGKKILITFLENTINILDVVSGDILIKLEEKDGIAFGAIFSLDGQKMLTVLSDNTIKIWEAATGKVLTNFKGNNDAIEFAVFNPDGKKILTLTKDKKVSLWDAESGTLLFDFENKNDNFVFAQFSPDGNRILTASTDNTASIWDVQTGRLIYTFFSIDYTDYFAQIPTGFYQSSPGATKLLHYVTYDLKVITFEQLDVKYNRPDKVLEAIGNTDTALIKSYRKAYEKRIKKLGIDTTAFRDGYSVPEADFVNRDAIEYEQKNETITLQIKGGDSTYKLDRFNVWVNEVPVFGLKGKSIRKINGNRIDTAITIKFSNGENRIETSITNVNGTESYRMPLIVHYKPAKPKKELAYFIGIGIDRFADNKYNLEYSSKDIRDLSLKLKEKYGNEIVIDTLFNENVTVDNVKALKKKLQTTTENDKVVIAYSGHGLLSKDYDYYLSTYGVNFEKPEINGLPYDELENLLDSLPARKKLMLIDACHSGEVDKEEGIAMNKTAESLGLSKGVIIPGKQQQVGLKNSFELMQSLFVNVGKSTGATIISAAAGNQFALERGDLKNGVFTFSILEAMNKYPTMKISELKKIVGERVEQLTNGMQKPTSRNETIAVDWEVW